MPPLHSGFHPESLFALSPIGYLSALVALPPVGYLSALKTQGELQSRHTPQEPLPSSRFKTVLSPRPNEEGMGWMIKEGKGRGIK